VTYVVVHVIIRFPIGHFVFASLDRFFGKTHRLAIMHTLLTDRRQTDTTQHCSISATVSTEVGGRQAGRQ